MNLETSYGQGKFAFKNGVTSKMMYDVIVAHEQGYGTIENICRLLDTEHEFACRFILSAAMSPTLDLVTASVASSYIRIYSTPFNIRISFPNDGTVTVGTYILTKTTPAPSNVISTIAVIGFIGVVIGLAA